MKLPPDFKELLEEFARSGVEYAVIGGYAFAFHARPRATKDLDVLVEASEENLRRVGIALAHFGVAPEIVAHATQLGPDEVVYFGKPPLRVDLLRGIDGVDAPRVFANAVSTDWDGVAVRVIGFDELIANKRASGRRQDLADVEVLERVALARSRTR